ncbi:Calcium-binding protein KIC [Platanthera guangdongensis]|uniref:Calcium-binding protein KIC n=1 Tax=Platanthera guangdongensis TaxID=2320717 RepID=A0ABR2MB82_9ASPA
MAEECVCGFVDLLPLMAERVGDGGLAEELCKGFNQLVDEQRGLITIDSLKKNSVRLGIGELGDEEAAGMLRLGDLDGDCALNRFEFCRLMLRFSTHINN